MIKVEVVEGFTLERFDELKNIVRKEGNKDITGKLFIGDIFECELEMYKYLTGENKFKRAFVEKIEIIPEKSTKKTLKTTAKVSSVRKRKILPKKDKYDTIIAENSRYDIENFRKEQR